MATIFIKSKQHANDIYFEYMAVYRKWQGNSFGMLRKTTFANRFEAGNTVKVGSTAFIPSPNYTPVQP